MKIMKNIFFSLSSITSNNNKHKCFKHIKYLWYIYTILTVIMYFLQYPAEFQWPAINLTCFRLLIIKRKRNCRLFVIPLNSNEGFLLCSSLSSPTQITGELQLCMDIMKIISYGFFSVTVEWPITSCTFHHLQTK